MEKQIYYNETIFINSDIPIEEPIEVYLTYDLEADGVQLSLDYNLDLKQLEKFAKDLLKFVNEIKKDIKNNGI